jgi:hypothetical protein
MRTRSVLSWPVEGVGGHRVPGTCELVPSFVGVASGGGGPHLVPGIDGAAGDVGVPGGVRGDHGEQVPERLPATAVRARVSVGGLAARPLLVVLPA